MTSTTVETKERNPFVPTFLEGLALATFTVAVCLVVYLITVATGHDKFNDNSRQLMITDGLPSCWTTAPNGWHYMIDKPCYDR